MKVVITIKDKKDGTVNVTAEFTPRLTRDCTSNAANAAIAAIEAIKELAREGTLEEDIS